MTDKAESVTKKPAWKKKLIIYVSLVLLSVISYRCYQWISREEQVFVAPVRYIDEVSGKPMVGWDPDAQPLVMHTVVVPTFIPSRLMGETWHITKKVSSFQVYFGNEKWTLNEGDFSPILDVNLHEGQQSAQDATVPHIYRNGDYFYIAVGAGDCEISRKEVLITKRNKVIKQFSYEVEDGPQDYNLEFPYYDGVMKLLDSMKQ